MPEAGQRRLDSWKEIASYLGRDVRTVRRWEQERSLPVHRVPGGGRAAVYALPSEIDAWLKGPQGPKAPQAPQTKGHTRQRLVIGLSLVVAVLLFGGMVFLRSHPEAHFEEPTRVTLEGSKVVAWSEGGRRLWDYDFGYPVLLDWPRLPQNRASERRVEVTDLKGDGHKEVVVASTVYEFGSPANTDALYCFRADGQLLWHYPFDTKLRCGGDDYHPNYCFGTMLVIGAQGRSKTIWAVANENPWWPSVIVKFDAQGRRGLRFVNAGHLESLAHVTNSSGSYILAGGINNEYQCAMLAVLEEGQPFATSPETPGSRFHCDNCPPGQPYRYFLFPRSELNRVTGLTFNEASSIQVTAEGIEVMTFEATEDGGYDWLMYDFSPEFALRSVSFSWLL